MTTAVQVQYRRGTATQVASFTGAQGELIVDTTDNRIVVQDGSTAGGWAAAKLAEVITNTRTAVTDANYTAQTTDRLIAYTAITAARSVTLPAAGSFPTGTCLSIIDESGACSPTNSITVSRGGSDMIDGGTSASITIAYGYLAVQSNGAGKWTIVDQATTNLPAVSIGTAYDPNNVLSVSGASALFSGSGNFNVTVNKGGSAGAASDTASFVFEDGFVGYGQIGLCGDDNFHFKVSNGTTWYDALDIVNSSGLLKANYGMTITSGDVMVGNNTATAPITVTSQTAALPSPQAGTQIHLVGSNSTGAAIQWNTYAANGQFFFERADGGLGSEAALANNDIIGVFGYRGYNGSGYSSNAGTFQVTANGAWSGSAQGTWFLFRATPNGSTTLATAMSISGGVIIGSGTSDPGAGNITVGGAAQIGSPTGGVLGAGTLNVASGIYLNNTAYTNPDFVFEKHFTGEVKKYADRPRAGSYRGLMQLDALAAHVRENLRLPGISDEPADIFERGDIALEKLEEHTLYILQLHRRVLALEARTR